MFLKLRISRARLTTGGYHIDGCVRFSPVVDYLSQSMCVDTSKSQIDIQPKSAQVGM